MKIFSSAQIKAWDAYTISNEPISSANLVERAATACYKWLLGKNYGTSTFHIFCGKGNNGGDGLAMARMLIGHGCTVSVYILEFGKPGTADFQLNLEKLHQHTSDIHFIQSADFFPAIPATDIIIDALFGSGLNKPLEGIAAALATHINNSHAVTVSIDLPSGLFADTSSKGHCIVKATHTLSFQNYKLAFLLAENESYFGEVHLLNIGLHPGFANEEPATTELVDESLIKAIYKPRTAFAHKGTYGHAAIIAGSRGMMGAAVLATSACLRSGVGKLTAYIPKCGYTVLQTTVPEAMSLVAGEDYMISAPGLKQFNAVGLGPGIGIHPSHTALIKEVFNNTNSALVIDADALNILSANQELLKAIPAGSVITPHPKEFDRLFGSTANDAERLQRARQKAKELNIYIVLKGHYSFTCTPEGMGYFNSTGNAGMATAGSGDVLTGIITGLLAQGYPSPEACILGVYLHGLAGDIAAVKHSPEAMIAGDIIRSMGDAFKQINGYRQ